MNFIEYILKRPSTYVLQYLLNIYPTQNECNLKTDLKFASFNWIMYCFSFCLILQNYWNFSLSTTLYLRNLKSTIKYYQLLQRYVYQMDKFKTFIIDAKTETSKKITTEWISKYLPEIASQLFQKDGWESNTVHLVGTIPTFQRLIGALCVLLLTNVFFPQVLAKVCPFWLSFL